ncbi:MAG TPA: hypothetical protein VF644_05115 [Pyrinomonadaceae bacterium]|jgi:hypothetical protein
MKISIFLSYPKPCFNRQAFFVARIEAYLISRGFAPRTLGVTDYDMNAPLRAIRRLMLESNGLITIAFRRTFVEKGAARYETDIAGATASPINHKWFTSPWSQIEPAMAYQLGLPILLLREQGVIDEGLLERGVVGLYMPEFDLSHSLDDYFNSLEWNSMIGQWEGYVRTVVDKKGNPPQLY